MAALSALKLTKSAFIQTVYIRSIIVRFDTFPIIGLILIFAGPQTSLRSYTLSLPSLPVSATDTVYIRPDKTSCPIREFPDSSMKPLLGWLRVYALCANAFVHSPMCTKVHMYEDVIANRNSSLNKIQFKRGCLQKKMYEII